MSAKKRGKRRVLAPEQRKEELLDAAAAVFSQKGYRAASISDIIDLAGVARGTFYHYFASKRDVFLELLESYFSEFAGILEDNHRRLIEALESGADPIAAWRENALKVFQFHRENPQLAALIYREAMGLDEHFAARVDELSALARRRLAEEFGIMAEMGLIVPCDVELVTTMVNGATINLIREHVLGDERYDLGTLADALVMNQTRALARSREAVDGPLGAPDANRTERKAGV